MIGAADGDLLNLYQPSNLTTWTTPFWPALLQAPKYRQIAELKDQLD